jgi:hypothetical protein
MTSPRLSAEQRRVLTMLATAGHDGSMRSLLIAHGFGVLMINALVSHELATLAYEKVPAGGKLIEVAKVRIRTTGRRAIEG